MKEVKNEIVIVNEEYIKDKIYTIRGTEVMLDFDLAKIYGYSTKRFNEQIKRNLDRFPKDFMFQLTSEELSALSSRSQIATLNESGNKRGSNIKYLPYAFSEQGIYMLMTVLKGDVAIKQSVELVRLFKKMKDYIITNNVLVIDQLSKLTLQVSDNTKEINNIKDTMVYKDDLSDFIKLFNKNIDDEEILLLNGQPFKGDVVYHNILTQAKYNVILIDDYINIKTLNHLSILPDNIDITIISDNHHNLLHLSDYLDYLKEYPNKKITFIRSMNMIHDRFIILDFNTNDTKLFHLGSSIKDTGNKITVLSQLHINSININLVNNLLGNSPLILK